MEPERRPRRLAAILYADIAGYSRATGADEDGTHETLRQYLDAVSAVVERHRGRVMHYAGDAVLATFAAAVDALEAGLEIHRDIATRNATLVVQRRIEFRVGVNLGDVIEDRGDVYGNGVNVAARLAALAEPGGICVSESARLAVAQRLPLEYRDIGSQRLKNIDEPVRAYRVTPGAKQSAIRSVLRTRTMQAGFVCGVLLAVGFGAVRLTDALPDASNLPGRAGGELSIAVVPFSNLGAQEDEYFSDGLTDELITRLARVPGLEVAGRTSSFHFKGRNELAQTIADELGVRYLLEGSVHRAGDRLRVRVQLTDTRLGRVLWAPDAFDDESVEVFAMQDRIALAVAENLEVELLAGPRSSITRHGTDSAQAQELYFRAKYVGQGAELADLDQAIDYYEQAITVDERYAAAYVGLANALIRRTQFAEAPQQSVFERARELLARALEIEPSAAAHATLAAMAHSDFDCERASKELAAAELIDANSVDMLLNYARHYISCEWGANKGVEYALRAAELDRLDSWVAHHVPVSYWHAFDYETALREVDVLARRFPDYWIAEWSRWWILSDLGRHDEALAVAEKVISLMDYNETQTCLAISLAQVGRIEEARAIYDRLETLTTSGQYWTPSFRALLLVALGEQSAAVDALQDGYDRRDNSLPAIIHIEMLRPLHQSAQFWDIVDRLGQRPHVEALIGRLDKV